MSASVGEAGLGRGGGFRLAGDGPVHPAARGWRRWERPVAAWCVIALCSGFWFAVLRLLGAV